jgi:hypothetical protein
MEKSKTDLKLVKGSRTSVKQKRKSPHTTRIALVPREDGSVTVIDPDTNYALRLSVVIVTTVPADCVGYEKLD